MPTHPGAPCSARAASRRPWGYALAAALVLTLPLRAQSNDALLQAVDAHYNHLSSLRCRYAETFSGMGITRYEYGALTLKRPGRMRWAYDKPTGKVFILDGKYAWFYTPGDEQVQRIPAKQLDDLRTPLRFLLGHTELRKELENIAVTPFLDNGKSNFRISGVPKGMAARIRQLSLVVTPNGIITEMKVEEIDGASTEFTFTDISENIPTDDKDFTFTPPPGVAIVNGTPPL